jgi:hypothetical protein
MNAPSEQYPLKDLSAKYEKILQGKILRRYNQKNDEILQGQTLGRGDQNDAAKAETPSFILPLRGGENEGNPTFVPPLKGEEEERKIPSLVKPTKEAVTITAGKKPHEERGAQ